MSNSVPFVISLYYRGAASNRVTISSTTITNTKTLFPTNTHLTDFQVQVPTVRGDEPWAGQYVGVRLASGLMLLDSALFGGYWDVDNVRLRVIHDPVLKDFMVIRAKEEHTEADKQSQRHPDGRRMPARAGRTEPKRRGYPGRDSSAEPWANHSLIA